MAVIRSAVFEIIDYSCEVSLVSSISILVSSRYTYENTEELHFDNSVIKIVQTYLNLILHVSLGD